MNGNEKHRLFQLGNDRNDKSASTLGNTLLFASEMEEMIGTPIQDISRFAGKFQCIRRHADDFIISAVSAVNKPVNFISVRFCLFLKCSRNERKRDKAGFSSLEMTENANQPGYSEIHCNLPRKWKEFIETQIQDISRFAGKFQRI